MREGVIDEIFYGNRRITSYILLLIIFKIYFLKT